MPQDPPTFNTFNDHVPLDDAEAPVSTDTGSAAVSLDTLEEGRVKRFDPRNSSNEKKPQAKTTRNCTNNTTNNSSDASAPRLRSGEVITAKNTMRSNSIGIVVASHRASAESPPIAAATTEAPDNQATAVASSERDKDSARQEVFVDAHLVPDGATVSLQPEQIEPTDDNPNDIAVDAALPRLGSSSPEPSVASSTQSYIKISKKWIPWVAAVVGVAIGAVAGVCGTGSCSSQSSSAAAVSQGGLSPTVVPIRSPVTGTPSTTNATDATSSPSPTLNASMSPSTAPAVVTRSPMAAMPTQPFNGTNVTTANTPTSATVPSAPSQASPTVPPNGTQAPATVVEPTDPPNQFDSVLDDPNPTVAPQPVPTDGSEPPTEPLPPPTPTAPTPAETTPAAPTPMVPRPARRPTRQPRTPTADATDPPSPALSPVAALEVATAKRRKDIASAIGAVLPSEPNSQALDWVVDRDPLRLSADSEGNTTRLIQRFALATLYYRLGGASWTLNNDWLTKASECDWDGVDCFDLFQSVISLRLNENNLIGSLPDELGLLSSIKTVNLASNPSLGGTLPQSVENWTLVEEVYFNNNAFTGELPTALAQWTALRMFWVAGNQFAGTLPNLPDTVWSLLQKADFSSNQFEGSLPTSIGGWSAIEMIDVSNNKFSGTLPQEVDRWANVQQAHFELNELAGTVPEGWCTRGGINVTVDCAQVTCTCCSNCQLRRTRTLAGYFSFNG